MEKQKIYCKKCGEEIKENDNFCRKCGKYITKAEEDKKAKVIIICFIICIGLAILLEAIYGFALINIFESANSHDILSDSTYKTPSIIHNFAVLPIAGALILIITGKNKYKENRIIEILFWVAIITIIVLMIFETYMFFLYADATCRAHCNTCG